MGDVGVIPVFNATTSSPSERPRIYRLTVIDARALEDLGQAILEDMHTRCGGTFDYTYSYSDISHIINIWMGRQPQLPRTKVDGTQY